jgi:hypothetical protein
VLRGEPVGAGQRSGLGALGRLDHDHAGDPLQRDHRTAAGPGQDGVIAENNPAAPGPCCSAGAPNFATGKASDGKGIDHGEEAFNSAIGAILGQCLG